MGVDQPGQDEVARPTEALGGGRRGRQLGDRSDGDDAVAVDQHAAVADDATVRIHREDRVAGHEQHGRMV